jgi:hypothetical protein
VIFDNFNISEMRCSFDCFLSAIAVLARGTKSQIAQPTIICCWSRLNTAVLGGPATWYNRFRHLKANTQAKTETFGFGRQTLPTNCYNFLNES